jgi:signal transduction histidine kinase
MHAEMMTRKIPASLLDKCRKVIMHIDEVDRMIQDLLDTNKLKAGEKIPVYPSDICLSDCVNEAVTDFVDLHGDRFILNTQENVCGHWCAKSMRRILDNLLSNAIKHGDPTRAITIGLKQVDHTTTLTVHNFGPGIPKSEQGRLFEPFKRSSKSLKKSGWGIGLSLVKGLVDAQGGKISLESSDQAGTTFIILFPNHAVETIH